MESPIPNLRPLAAGASSGIHASDVVTCFLLPLSVWCFNAKLFMSVLGGCLCASSLIVLVLDYRGGPPAGNVSILSFVPAWAAITFIPELATSRVRMYLTFWTVLLYRPIFNRLTAVFRRSFTFGEAAVLTQGGLLASCVLLNKLYWFPNLSVFYLGRRTARWLDWLATYAARPGAVRLVAVWTGLAVASVLLVVLYKQRGWRVTTLTRKIFHLSVVLVYVPGLLYDPLLLYTASLAATALFLLLEMIRYTGVPLLGPLLNNYLRHFTDDKDNSGCLILTNIYLLVGVSMPLWLWPGKLDVRPLPLPLYAGVISVGIGDAASSIVGSLVGRLHWPGSSGKTMEGAAAGFLAMLAAGVWITGGEVNMATWSAVCAVTAVFEASVDQVDNLTLPLVMYSGLHLIQLMQQFWNF